MSAYYSRNDSFSRSYNAECAEAEGRLPRTRAAAALGVSVKAFDAGCRAAGYVATEWHHVGKYAARIDYYDTRGLRRDKRFWLGAARAYRNRATRQSVLEPVRELLRAQLLVEPETCGMMNRKSKFSRLEELRVAHRFLPNRIARITELHMEREGLPLSEDNWLVAEAKASQLITS